MSTIKINNFFDLVSIKLCYFKDFKILLFSKKNATTFYKQLSSVQIEKNKSFLILQASWRYLNNFFNFYRNLIFKARGFLILKGLGLKVQIVDDFLEFKLGYSHRCFVKLDKEVGVKIKKNLLFLQSVNTELLGNFLYKIKILKKPDVYKGKGIWYKNERISLKPVKKSK